MMNLQSSKLTPQLPKNLKAFYLLSFTVLIHSCTSGSESALKPAWHQMTNRQTCGWRMVGGNQNRVKREGMLHGYILLH